MRIRSAIAAVALVGVFSGAVASLASIPITALDPTPQGIITQVNTYLGNLLSASTNTGELQFFQSQSWATNSNVATTMTSLGPQGSHTTIQKWLVVVDNGGTVRYIPAY